MRLSFICHLRPAVRRYFRFLATLWVGEAPSTSAAAGHGSQRSSASGSLGGVGSVGPLETKERFRGCLLGGAVGDAVGAPVEFCSLAGVRARFGPNGVSAPIGDELTATDDTQMTLFTAEGLIRSSVRWRSKGISHTASIVRHAYMRWLHTQGVPWRDVGQSFGLREPNGWLVAEERLHRRRAPGATCLAALHLPTLGSIEQPPNDSKGCGAVMRAAPVGLVFLDPERAFRIGCEVSAVTHGHPSGWLSGGVLAACIAGVLAGRELSDALAHASVFLSRQTRHEETSRAIAAAVAVARTGLPTPEQLETLGSGWVGEEALAIALSCALSAPDFESGVLAAVNHSGDSDSTGSLCGNLLGAVHGEAAIPYSWRKSLDVGDIVEQMADDLWTERFDPPVNEWNGVSSLWWGRYPGH